MASPVRAFLAIQPPEEVRVELSGMNLGLEKYLGWRRLPPENIHLTVRFLGAVSVETHDLLTQRMDQLGRGLHGINIEIEKIFGFPARKPAVIAAAITPTRELMLLAERVETMVTGVGLEADHRAFRPHITIARLSGGGHDKLSLHIPLHRSFNARELVLFKSELGRDGARYIRLHSARLGV